MPSNTIVPASQIAKLQTGLKSILDSINGALQTKVWEENLPIVGSLVTAAAGQGETYLAQFGSLETKVLNALNSFNNVSTDINTLQTAINNALQAAGFPKGVTVSVDPGGDLVVALNDQFTDSFSAGLGSNFGVPGLDFQTSGNATTQLTYELNVIGTVDAAADSFSLSSPNGTPLAVTLDVTAPTFAANAILGDLQFGVANNTSLVNGVENATSLLGTFSLDANGGATFTGDANLNLNLTSNMGTAALPSVSANLLGGWHFTDSTVDPNNPQTFGDTPTIALDNVTFQIGSFVDNVIDPLIDDVNAVLQSAPIQTIEALFDTPISFLGGAGHMNNGTVNPDDGLLGKLWHSLDVAGSINAGGTDVGDGTITLVDFLQLAANNGAPIDVTPLVQFLSALNQVQNWVSALASAGTTFGLDSYNLGSFTIPDDIRSAAQLISRVTPELIPGSQPIDLDTMLQNLVDAAGSGGGTGSGSSGQNPSQALQSLLTSNIFSFPIITNPIEAVQFLLGGTADLFDANLPPASFNFGSINAAGNPTSTFSLANVPIPIFPGVTLDLGLNAAFQGSAQIDFGYDTSGISAFEKSGFTNYADLLDGIFVQSPIINGTVQPVVQLAGDVQAEASLNALGNFATASASGDIGGVLDLTFSQPGKNYIDNLLNAFKSSPLSIFSASGKITAGFQLAAHLFPFPQYTFTPQRILLADFGGAAVTTSSSEPAIPTSTTWIGGASGDFETASNWNPTFAALGTDYYGEATIGGGSTVTFQGTAAADLVSLNLASNSVVNIAHGQLTIEDSTNDSSNSGVIVVGGTANLDIAASFTNTGTIRLTGGTLVASGVMDLTGGGSIVLPDAKGSFIQSTDASAVLLNEDNTISGGGTIGADLLNDGTVNANVSKPLVLAGSDANSGLMEATGNGGAAGTPITGGLDIDQSLDNTAGTLGAFQHGVVILEDGVTVAGGTLETGSIADSSLILTEGSVTLDGGTTGLDVAGAVLADNGSTLTLTGLINSGAYSTTLGQSQVASGSATVLLQGATIHNGFLNALQPTSGGTGTMAVSGTATLDGSAGDGSIGIDGIIQVGAGNTLVVDGSVNPGLSGGGIDLAGGTLVIGNGITDAATLGTSLPGSTSGTGGTLTFVIDDNSVVTGADAGSSLTNNWNIQGSGSLGNGQLAIINTANGTIAAGFGELVINGGVPLINAGLIQAALGSLDLQSDIANAGGTILSLALDSIGIDGVTIAGGALSGGGVFFGSLGGFVATGHAMLDGTASPVTLEEAADLLVSAGATLTLAGSIDNGGPLNDATIAVQGDASTGGVAVLQASGSVTLGGGGVVALSETSGAGTSYTQEITGSSGGGTLDNINNGIVGYGSIGIGDTTLTLINEAAGTIDANLAGDTLVLNTGTNTVTNHGLLEATNGGTLDLHGNIANAGATLLAAGGIALLDGARLSGGAIVSSGTGSVRVAGTATLDGTAHAISVAAGADVAVDSGDTLTALGTIVNNGIMQATGGTLVLATGAVAVANLGRLGADDGGVLDLRSNVSNAGGTIAVTSGDVLLDGMTVTNGLLAGEQPDTGFIDVAGSATVIGTGTVAAGVNTSPTTGLLNTADLRVQGGDTLTLQGTITNRGVISLAGNASASATAALHASGTVTLTGGGVLSMQDSSAAESPTSQLVTGTSATSTLDNINNTISGEGLLGNADGLLTLINEIGGTVDAVGTSLIVNTFTHAIVNKGLLESTTGDLYLNGTVANTGTIAANGGAVELDGATVNGGVLATSAGGIIGTYGSATLNGIPSAVTLTSGANVMTGGAGTLTLEGSIVNHGVLGLEGDSVNDLTAKLRVLGTVTLSGGGHVSLTSVGGAPSSTYQVISDPVASDTLDNIDNTIAGYGQIGGGALNLRNESAGIVEATGGTLVVNTGTSNVINKGVFAAVGGALDLQSVVDSTGGGTLQALDLGVGGAPGVIVLDGGTLRGGTVVTSLADTASHLTVSVNGGTLDGTAGAVTLAAGAQALVGAGTTLTLTGSLTNHGTVGLAGDSYNDIAATLQIAGTTTLSGGGDVSLYSVGGGPSSAVQIVTGASATAKLDNIDNTISGYGSIEAGQFKLINETAGTIEAAGGALVLNTGTNTVSNHGLLEGVGGTLVVEGVIDSTSGGTVATVNGGGVSGIVQLDGGTLRGGTLRTDPTDPTSQIQITGNGGTLDGTAGTLTIAANSQVVVVWGSALTAEGAIANHGTLEVEGYGAYGYAAEMLVAGTLALSGGGLLRLADGSGYGSAATEVVTGSTGSDTLDNIDNTIVGYGSLGAGRMTLINAAGGRIEAAGGVLTVDTAANVITNKGLMEAVGGTLVLRGAVDNSGGGTIAALNQGGSISGVVLLDGATLRGGTIVTDLADPTSVLTVSGNGGTLDGTATAVTIAAGAHVQASYQTNLTIAGALINHGALDVFGYGAYSYVSALTVADNVTLSGGGTVSLQDVSGYASTVTQVITGATAADTLDNVDNTIIGVGSLGAGQMTLINAAAGKIEAAGGVLLVDTGANVVTNTGLMEALGGTLELRGVVDNTSGGTIAALNQGGSVTGVVLLDGATLRGGTIVTDLQDAASMLTVSGNGGTLDGTGATVTFDAGVHAQVGWLQTLTVEGKLANHGVLDVLGYGAYGYVGELAVAGDVTLSGGGVVALLDPSGYATTASEVVTGVTGSDTLDNVDNTIIGLGSLGAGAMTLINETKGTIEATGGTLRLDAGTSTVTNHGLLSAVAGTLELDGAVTNTGSVVAGAGGNVDIVGTVANSGLINTASGGTITLLGSIIGAGSTTDIASGATLLMDGGMLQGGTLNNAAGGAIDVLYNAGGTFAALSVVNAGAMTLAGYGAYSYVSELTVTGDVTLSGGGTVSLLDSSGYGSTVSQVITGASATDTLDNVDNTIIGYGSLGAGAMTLINETKGTIEAAGGTLRVDTGTNAVTSHGLLIAVGGTLELDSAVTSSGTVLAGAGGDVDILGTVANTGVVSAASGGTITLAGGITGAGSATNIASGGTLLMDGGMLQGGTLNNAAGGAIDVLYSTDGTFAAMAVVNAGSMSLAGYGAYSYISELTIAGDVTLSGGGTVSLLDASGYDWTASQVITGATGSDTLDNVDNTIIGYGSLGAGQLTLINEAKGTIEAAGGVLLVDTGTSVVTNKGLMEAVGNTLELRGVVDSTGGGTIAALNKGGASGVILLDGATLRGGTIVTDLHDPASMLMLSGNGGTLDGSAATVTLAAGVHAEVAAALGAQTLTVEGKLANSGVLDVFGYGIYGYVAALQVSGDVTLSGGGTVSLADSSGYDSSATQVISGTSGSDTLDDVNNTIIGYGSLGAGQMTLINEAAGMIDAYAGDLIVNTGTASVTNAGLMQSLSNGTLDVVSNLINTGKVLSNGGTVVLEGPVTGTGTLGLESSDLVLDGSASSGQTIAFFNFGTAETLDLGSPGSVAATLSGFASKDTIISEGTILTGVTYHATSGTLGVLSLMDGSTTVGTLTLAGTYTNAQFKLTNNAGSPSIITTTATAGQLYTHATASTATPAAKNFGTHHVGDTLTQALTIKNTATAGSFTENLDVGFVATTGAATDSGSITGLAAGVTNSTSLLVGLSTVLDGAQSGTVVLTPSSDGTGIDGFGTTPLASQTIAVSGVLYNYATASTTPVPVDFGQHHTGETLNQKLTVKNNGINDGYTENLDASLGGATGAATGSGSFTGLGAQIANSSSLTIGVNATKDGLRTGNVVLTLHSDGAGIDALASTLLTAQTIAATGTIFNYATASVASKSLGLGAHHVGDTVSKALTITNSGTADGFTENLDVGIVSTTGSLTASGSIVGLGAGKTDSTSITLGLPSAGDGTKNVTVVLSLTSDGTGIDNLGTTVLAAQTITATSSLYNYATASAVTPGAVNFGTHHVGDVLSQALSITNTGVADAYTEKLDGSFGTTTGAATGTTSFTGLAAGKTSSALLVGLSTTQDGERAGTVTLSLNSDGTGLDGLGTTILAAQTIDATGTLYNYATASTAALVNLGNHHIGDTINQALTVTNTGTADGFTETLDAGLGGATGAATAGGSITGLAAAKTDNNSLTIGVTTAKDGVQSGKAVLTLHSDGTGIDGLGSTLLTAQTIAATGTIYNYATANAVAPVSFGNRHVGDALSQALSIINVGTADGFTETLDAGIGSATGAVTAGGTLTGLAAGITNSSSVTLGLSSVLDGVHGGSAVLGLKSDGTGVDGLGTTALTAQTIAATGTLYNYATASAATPNTVNFGIHHVGDALSQALSISNLGTTDGFTENLDAGIGAMTNAGTGSGSFSGLIAGGRNGTAIAVGLSTTHDGVQTGTTALTLSSDGTGIDGLGKTVLTAQTIAVAGTLYNYATANVAGVVNLGTHHVGDTISQALSVTNTGSVDAYTEELDASLGGASAGAFANGSLNLDAPGHTAAGSMTLGLTSTTEGNHAGTATLTLASDGSLVDGLAKTALVAQTVTMTAAVFGYATPILSASTLDFGAVRVGGTVAAKSLTISNGATADLFRENLGYSLETPSAGFAVASGATGTVVAGAAGTTANLNLVTSTAGAFTTTSDVVDLTSLGAGTSGLANTTLASQKVTLRARVYAPAVAKLQAGTIAFGVEHVGDEVTIHDSISNGATGALTDVLTGGVGTITASAFHGFTFNQIGTAGLAAGAAQDIAFQLNTDATGIFSGSASLVLASHDSDLADIAVNAAPIILLGTVDNYATAALEEVSGGGVFTQAGSTYTLDLGTVVAGGSGPVVTIGALNAATGLADLMSGSFQISGSSAFLNSGTVAFSGLGAGQADTAPTISLATTQTGTFSETLTLTATGSNSGSYWDGAYSEALVSQVLTITGTVVAGGPGDAWLVDAPGNFDNPAQWSEGIVPGVTNDASINFADQPQVVHASGSDSVHSLTNTAGDFVMSGGSLTAGALTNASAMSWTGGSLILNSGTTSAGLSNSGSLAITPNGQRLSAIGTGTGSMSNAGTVMVDGALGSANIDVAFLSTGNVLVNRGTLSLNGGGSANAFLLQTGPAGVLQFGAPAGQTSGGTFALTGGIYGGVETVISGSTLDASAASGVYFSDLRLTASGALLLGAASAQVNASLIQGGASWANAAGTPYLAGSGTFTVYGGASLTGGVESGSGLTRLFGTGSIGGTFAVDGGRTIENDGFLTWSSGIITLGGGDAAAVTQAGTLENVAGAILYVGASGGRLAIGAGGSGVLANAGVAAFYAGAGEVDIDAAVANTGYVQALSGVLSLNGGGSSDAGHLVVAPGATLQFGARAGTTGGAVFTLTGGALTAGSVVVSGSTLNATAAAGVSMGSLTVAGSGALLLGGVNGQTSGAFSQGPGVWQNASGVPFLSGSGSFTVFGGANLTGGVQSGSGLTRLYGTGSIGGGFAVDGGRTIENDGWLNWFSGSITLGAGDTGALTQAGTLTNAAGATLFVTASGGRIADAAGGVVNNAGVMAVYGGGGEVDVDATLANTGYIQALSGTLSLNGGGSSDAGHLIEGSGAVLQFGTASSGGGGTFKVTGGFYSAPVTVVTGGTLDLSAASGASFGTSMAVSGSGVLALGSLFVEANAVSVGGGSGGGMLRSNGIVVVNGPAALGSGVLSGAGTVVLEEGGSINGALQLDGGLTLQNSGVLDWTGGSVALGSGDAAAATQAGVLNNVAGAVFEIETSGTISTAGSGTVFNGGTILADGFGTTLVNATVQNSGTIVVAGQALTFGQTVGGAGLFVLDGAATLDFVNGAASGSTMQFLYAGDTLETQALGNFASTISGFGSGDVIDAAAVGFVTGTTTVGFTGGTLTVSAGGQSAAFMLSGSYAADGFRIIGSDGHGGTEIGYS